MPCRTQIRMMIVVPAFAEGQRGNPPVIARIVMCRKPARAPHMSSGVNQPRGMKAEDDPEADAPEPMDGRRSCGAGFRAQPSEANGNCSAKRRSGALLNRAHTWTSCGCSCDWLLQREATPHAPTSRRRAVSVDHRNDQNFDDVCDV